MFSGVWSMLTKNIKQFLLIIFRIFAIRFSGPISVDIVSIKITSGGQSSIL